MAEGGAPDCLLLVPFQLPLSSFLKVEGRHQPHSFDRDHSSLFAELSGWGFMPLLLSSNVLLCPPCAGKGHCWNVLSCPMMKSPTT